MDLCQQIKDYDHLNGHPCIYVLQVENGYYKFGKTSQLSTRLRTHLRKLKFMNIVHIFNCVYEQIMHTVELSLKKLAKLDGVLVNKYEQTEIIHGEIAIYCEHVSETIRNKLANYVPVDNVVIDTNVKLEHVDVNNNKTCHLCKKVFRTPVELQRHKNRNVPCVITELPVNQVDNPNRCTTCNKIFIQKQHLTRHQKKCKSGVVEDNRLNMQLYNHGPGSEFQELVIRANKQDKQLQEMREQLDHLQEMINSRISITIHGDNNNIAMNNIDEMLKTI